MAYLHGTRAMPRLRQMLDCNDAKCAKLKLKFNTMAKGKQKILFYSVPNEAEL